MVKVISRESIIRANDKVVSGRSSVTGRDSSRVSARVSTTFGTKEVTVSRDCITKAASVAMKMASKSGKKL